MVESFFCSWQGNCSALARFFSASTSILLPARTHTGLQLHLQKGKHRRYTACVRHVCKNLHTYVVRLRWEAELWLLAPSDGREVALAVAAGAARAVAPFKAGQHRDASRWAGGSIGALPLWCQPLWCRPGYAVLPLVLELLRLLRRRCAGWLLDLEGVCIPHRRMVRLPHAC